MKPSMVLRVTQGLGQIPVSFGALAISELSPLELEVALDNGLAELKHDSQQPEGTGNYFFSDHFYRKCQEAKGSIPQAELLGNPQILVETDAAGNYAISYNASLIQRIEDKLKGFKRDEDNSLPDRCFSLKVRESLRWKTGQQVTLADYLLKQQAVYLESKIPMDLKSVGLKEVAEATGLSISYVDRLARNLSIQLPSEEIIFVKDLITGRTLKKIQGVYLLGKLQQDTEVYEDGRWKASTRQLVSLLQDRYGFKITDKPLTEYLRGLRSQQVVSK